MKYFALPNLNWLDTTEVDPKDIPKIDYSGFESKKEFREWCNSKGTKHCFYSCVEAIDPTHRVTVDNPAYKMYGWVVDFDAEANQSQIDLIPSNGAAGLLPRWVSRTFSNHRRVVYEFEKPILVDNQEITDRFLKLLAKELKVKNILPSLDDCSFKVSQYQELGRDWQEIPGWTAIPSSVLSLLFYKAAGQNPVKGDGPEIPIEVIAEEVEKKFPGRWVGEFAEGARGPLFWIPDGIDRVGCQVGTHGMLCYSDRAGKSFVSWGEVFGKEFIRTFQAERIGVAAENVWFDGRHYWLKEEDGVWRSKNKEDTIMWLKCRGISHRIDAKQTASEAEHVLNTVQKLRQIKAAAPIVHDKRESVMINGERYLNTSMIEVVKPADTGDAADFPWLKEFFDNIWEEPKATQRDHFFMWLRHFYSNALAGTPAQGHGVIIAGAPSSGKTFMNHQILGRIFGGHSDASNFLMGKTAFNKENAQVGLWAMDDAQGAGTWETKSALAAAMKQHIANPEVRCEGKGTNSFTIPWNGRIIAGVNTDNESLGFIPNLNINILDKLMLFWWTDKWRAVFLPNKGSESVVASEIPYFLRWLLDWKEPAELISRDPRYHVKPYHHPNMLKHAHDSSPEARLAELMLEWRSNAMFKKEDVDQDGCMWMTATKIRKELAADPSARDALKEFSRQRMAVALERMGKSFVRSEREHKGCTEYSIVVNK